MSEMQLSRDRLLDGDWIETITWSAVRLAGRMQEAAEITATINDVWRWWPQSAMTCLGGSLSFGPIAWAQWPQQVVVMDGQARTRRGDILRMHDAVH
jgi:hypothetical protein